MYTIAGSRLLENPLKLGLPSRSPFTRGLPIPYDAVGTKAIPPNAGAGFAQYRSRENRVFQRRTSRRIMATVTKMTQSQMIKELAAAVGVTTKVAKSFTIAYAELAIRETKKNGVSVLPGIGRLVRQDRKARMGRNPATGAAIKIPAKKVVKFRVAKAVKDAIVPPKVKK
jgi:DNA-binding protein HU-beta